MNTTPKKQFFVYVVLMALLWAPVAAWLMPPIAGAPSWGANPTWYVSAAIMGIVLTYALRWLANRLAAYRVRSTLTAANR